MSDGALNSFDSLRLKFFLMEVANRPSGRMRPRVFLDGDHWCALYGDDLQTGVSGFGKTPEEACNAFDHAWGTASPPSKQKGGG